MPRANEHIVRVALDVPVDQLFDYRAGDISVADIGARAEVPFRSRRAIAVIVEIADASNVRELKQLGRVFRDAPRLSQETLELARFCAGYYHYPLGQVIMLALPPLMRRSVPALASADGYALTEKGAALEVSSVPPRQLVKRRVFAKLKSSGWCSAAELRALSPRASKVLREMLDEAIIAPCAPPRAGRPAQSPRVALNNEQQDAVQKIHEGGTKFQPWLLQGVTGSGKTEVYLSLIAQALDRGGQALLLVPEINLTPQLLARLTSRFPDRHVVPLHSGMAGGERLRNWISAQDGAAHVIVGTRLAVFTPMPKLALIVVDEEHDSSFKQQERLRYSARDLAVFRGKLASCPVVLGSATPSLESYSKALEGGYRFAALTRRAMNASLPEISLVDLVRERPADGLSPQVLHEIAARLQNREQSLLFINRRGYAPALWCSNCNGAEACPRCSANLVLHARSHALRCHHCGHTKKIPATCASCGNPELLPLGQGTQRVEQTLHAHFANARVLRIDRDSTQRRGAWEEMLRRIESGGADILVGTQIIAKGHDFPKLTLVAVLDADQALYASDFRASEKLFAQLMQVAGRAGRARAPGKVIIQTRFPQHPVFRALQAHDYSAFAEALLEERRRAGFPPFVHQALLRAEAPYAKPVFDFLKSAAEQARGSASSVTVYDPVPAVMSRIAGRERGQLLVQSASRRTLQAFLARWMAALRRAKTSRVRWSLDVDPLEF